MITPIVMLVLMVLPYIVLRVLSAMTGRIHDLRGAGAIGLGVLFTFTAIGHFVQTGPMAEMLPPWVPSRVLLVYLTGVLELAIALGFLLPRTRRMTGWAAAVLLVSFFPVNVYAAIQHVPMGGHAWGPIYLLVRAPLQAVTLLWVYWMTIRPPDREISTIDTAVTLP